MAIVYCAIDTGVQSYVLHASYSVTPDPYPSGATITKFTVIDKVKNNSSVTVRANELSLSSGYTTPVNVYKSSNGSTWEYVDFLQSGTVSVNVGSGSIYIKVGPAKQQSTEKTYYYKYRYLNESGGKISDSSVYNKKSSSGFITVTLSDIPTISGYVKTGSYSNVRYCAVDEASNFARCTSTMNASPSIIGVYVVPSTKIFYYQYRYLEQDGTQISNSFIYAKSESSEAPYTSVTLSSIPAPSTGNWKKTGQYFGIAYCTIVYSQDSARCTSTSTANPSIIGVYCSKSLIDLFTWTGSDSGDNAAFARGKSISSALTATRWNAMLAKIKEVAEANGGSFTYSTVSRGDKILATTFNAARTGISNLSGHGTLPSAQSKGNNILATLFVGTASLKSALNAAINAYNNS